MSYNVYKMVFEQEESSVENYDLPFPLVWTNGDESFMPEESANTAVNYAKNYVWDPMESSFINRPLEVRTVEEKSDREAHVEKDNRIRETCDLCGKRLRPGGMKYHKMIHSGEMPFKCESCPRLFRRIADLKKHKAIAHAAAPSIPQLPF